MSRFSLGRLYITPGAHGALTPADVWLALCRHCRGDWGQLDPDDRKENEAALQQGRRLLSAYHSRQGVAFWIITEADRSATTVLLPEDY
jgi:hypothetical protein